MSNKFLLLPFIGILIPIIAYTISIQLTKLTRFYLAPVGEIAIESGDRELEPTGTIESEKIVFVGDVLLARQVENLISQKGTNYPFKNSGDIFNNARLVVGNFESAILQNHIKTPSYITTFSVAKENVPLLKSAGFTHVSLANNHSFDYGTETFLNTVSVLTESGITPFGDPNTVSTSSVTILQSGNYKVGIIALHGVFSEPNTNDIFTQLNTVSAETDFQIAYIHWGEEYVLKHNQTQEDLAIKLIDAGIDAVIGHHPHVTQDIQVYNGRPIFYSLGNFLFDQYFSVDVQQGLAVTLAFATNTVEYELIPVSSEGSLSQPYRMPEKERALFLKNLARRSASEYTENIAQGKLILPLYLATSTQTGMIAPLSN